MATTKITSPDLFDLGSLNTALKLPSGTTAERPTSPSTGEWRYNTTTNLVEFWDGGEWRDLQSENIPPINSENFNTVLWTGNGTSQSITGVGFKPDWIWIKERTSTSNNVTFDSTRGIFEQLYITTDAESNNTSTVSSFDSDGFSLNGGLAVNENGQDYVAWCWKANGGTTSSNTDGSVTSTVQANTKAGFSIITWAGTGGVNTVGHGLNSAPELILIKGLSSAGDWQVYSSPTGNGNKLALNTSAAQSSTTRWDSTSPTSSVFTLNDSGLGTNLVAYAFQSVAGYSSIGSFVGNGSTNGPIVNTGFEPAFVMTKRSSTTGGWVIWDNKRSTTNPRLKYLQANVNNAEGTLTGGIDFLSNGFQLKDTDAELNGNGDTLIYIAFGSDASAAPALADSFANKLYAGTSATHAITGLGFSPSLVWTKDRGNAEQHVLNDIVRNAGNDISSNSTAAQANRPTGFLSFDNDGFTLGTDGGGIINDSAKGPYVAWNWKASTLPTINTDGTIQSIVSANQASGFSILTWTGTGAQGTIGHGLSVAPELIISKRLDSTNNWIVYDKTLSLSHTSYPNWLYLNLNSSEQNSGSSANHPYYQAPSSTLIYQNTGTSESTNVNGGTYVSYCFTSITGFSNIGSYTGNGSTQSITGLGFQPSWVLIKETSAAESWRVFDSARGATKRLFPDLSNAESTASDSLTAFDSDGFSLGSSAGVNENTQTYIYMAFKENPTPRPLAGNMSFLTIAGGGGGGNRHGGGGGAGGLRTSYGGSSGGGSSAESDITLAAGTYTITVGGGGAGVAYNTTAGVNGTNSVLSGTGMTTITSDGGGGGGISISPNIAGSAGGSGGGGGSTSTGGSATANQGKDGGQGTGQTAPDYGGGGGGGATLIGNNGAGTGGGNGGNGLAVSITGSSVSYAGGGGGSSFATAIGGLGGDGGGGNGAGTPLTGQSGTANLGGGGGGTTYDGGFSGAGGSGVVILRLATSEYSSSTTGSPTVTTDGDYTVLTYTGSGTYVHS